MAKLNHRRTHILIISLLLVCCVDFSVFFSILNIQIGPPPVRKINQQHTRVWNLVDGRNIFRGLIAITVAIGMSLYPRMTSIFFKYITSHECVFWCFVCRGHLNRSRWYSNNSWHNCYDVILKVSLPTVFYFDMLTAIVFLWFYSWRYFCCLFVARRHALCRPMAMPLPLCISNCCVWRLEGSNCLKQVG